MQTIEKSGLVIAAGNIGVFTKELFRTSLRDSESPGNRARFQFLKR